MSVPPPGGWQPPQQPGPPPPGWQPGPWQQQPGPPPNRGNGLKWLLIAVAVLLVVAVSIGGTLLFTRDGGGGGGTTTTSAAPSDFASANDTGPVKVITDEPTCKIFNGINNTLAAVQKNGWPDVRSTLGPGSEWTPEQRAQVAAVATSARDTADQVVVLAKQTPNRVVREIYQQLIAYGRAYADSVPNYTPVDDELASAWVSAGTTMIGICNTIEYGSTSRSLMLGAAAPPSNLSPLGDLSDPSRFVTSPSSTCTEWTRRLDKFNSESSQEWQDRDTSIPASQWTPEQRAIVEAAVPLLKAYSSDIEAAGRQSNNPVFEDFAGTAGLYIRAYLAAAETYNNADGWLNYTGFQIANLIYGACLAAG